VVGIGGTITPSSVELRVGTPERRPAIARFVVDRPVCSLLRLVGMRDDGDTERMPAGGMELEETELAVVAMLRPPRPVRAPRLTTQSEWPPPPPVPAAPTRRATIYKVVTRAITAT
jgi:hypothetical protein